MFIFFMFNLSWGLSIVTLAYKYWCVYWHPWSWVFVFIFVNSFEMTKLIFYFGLRSDTLRPFSFYEKLKRQLFLRLFAIHNFWKLKKLTFSTFSIFTPWKTNVVNVLMLLMLLILVMLLILSILLVMLVSMFSVLLILSIL